MIAPELPSTEASRLEVLRSLHILDTAPEARFDRLTRLAKRVFRVPIVLISLVDENRQWFKSRQGLDAPETPRDISFCGHAILGNDVLMIPDAALDPRFSDNPLVLGEPHIRFYAGCPLAVSGGTKLGTLCLIDREPRQLDAEEIELLRDLASMAEQEIASVHLATVDDLTLLFNRRGFLAFAKNALGLCTRLKLPVSIIFIDLDGFKAINDKFGHAQGDQALASFAQLLTQSFRESELIGRLGGDEFVVLMPNCALADSQFTLRRLERLVEQHNTASQKGYDIRFSSGSASYDTASHGSIEGLLAQADKRMYQAKREGCVG